MRLCSFALLFISFSSISSTTFNQALIDAGEAIEHCNLELKQNITPFPVNEWFESLSQLDKRLVVGYISLKNSENCALPQMEQLRTLSVNLSPQQRELLNKSTILEPLKFKGDLSHLDMSEIERLQKKYPQPFDTFRVLEELKLWD
ncbi:TPA: hypothetical protein JG809_004580 [Vibrio parahaemolyticus]|uniref:hypothetical protein n=1 Tax=Vibrio parahaemolyticus TaxID=670 RepID=UPI00111E5867|nr:hypothetical protein [Vibrio parahaemolyticus]EJA7342721.1 hypothetical protein [Vibrio parahaemolyticus]MDF4680031.1 hypothetical protein [Vibrio parahaemolyticus]MDF4922530.1 hypothetical protein [Vibrio parahaemolyticus]MEA5333364.1 hypothetical protein [Vibrio parahaemolyticus]MEA5344110.1 hypothetical protein [Vibrio parahaemolyticus]